MEFLLVKLLLLKCNRFFFAFRINSALCGLRSKAQQCIHWKRLGQIRQRVKLRQPARPHSDRRKYHHWQLPIASIHNQGLNVSLTECCAQDIPTCLVRKIYIEDNQIVSSSTQKRECCPSIPGDAHLVPTCLKVAIDEITQDLVILN